MAYLDFEEYKQMERTKITDESEFKKVEQASEDLFNTVTRDYYVFNEIKADPDHLRVSLFKKALAIQCEFFNDIGAFAPYEIFQQQVSSVSVGRTHIESGGGGISGSVSGKTGIYNLAMNMLARTGLLYRGIKTR